MNEDNSFGGQDASAARQSRSITESGERSREGSMPARTPWVLTIQMSMAKTPETEITSAVFAGREATQYHLRAFINRHPNELVAAEWYVDASRANDFRCFNVGPASVWGKSVRQKAEYGWRKFRAVPDMVREARKYGPDVVTSTQNQNLEIANTIARALHIPLVPFLIYPMSPYLGKNALSILPNADCVIACSDFIRRNAGEFGVQHVKRIYPSVRELDLPSEGIEVARHNVRDELAIPHDAIVILQGARIVEHKGQVDIVRSFDRFAQDVKYKNVWLVFAGSGEGDGQLKTAIALAKSASRIRMVGVRSDMTRLFAASDIVAHPSRSEAFGLATAEASLFGLPVVGYKDGAFPEIIDHGVSGFAVPLNNDDPRSETSRTSSATSLATRWRRWIPAEWRTISSNSGVTAICEVGVGREFDLRNSLSF